MLSVPVLVVDILAVCKLYFSYQKMPGFSCLQILCSDLVSVNSFVVNRFAILKALIDVLVCVVLEAFEFLLRVIFLRVNLLFFAERRFEFGRGRSLCVGFLYFFKT